MRETEFSKSYYFATANPSYVHPRLRGELSCDVCVVGAGYTGLSAALSLAERGYKVIVLESRRVGHGASGRNGGQMLSGFAPGLAGVAELLGRSEAARLWGFSEAAKALVRQRISQHDIACDFRPGALLGAAKRSHIAELREEQELAQQLAGYRGYRLVDKEELAAHVGSGLYHGGLLDDGAGHLHPLNYALGLADAALRAGVEIYEESRVTAIDHGAMTRTRTAEGSVRSRFGIFAGNAYAGAEARKLQRKIMPVGTYIVATESLGRERARQLIPNDICVSDTKFVLDYFRMSADHRLLFGGRVSYSGVDPWNIAAAIQRRMIATFPDLSGVKIEYAWGGYVAITRNRLPCFGRFADNAYFAGGFSGQGVALTAIAGELMADMAAGQAERFDVMAKIRHIIFPGGPWLRMPALVLATLYYRLRDWL